MRWLAPLTIGLAALVGGFSFGRILGPDPNDPELMPENPYAVLVAVVFYGTAFLAILGVIAIGLRRLAISERAREWQIERALGGTLRSVVASEARLGLRHGALVSGTLLVAGASARQLLPWFDGQGYLGDGHFAPSAVAGLVVVAVMCVGATVVVYVIAALTDNGASAASHDAPASVRPARTHRPWGRVPRRAAVGVFVVATAALIWRRLVPAGHDASAANSWSTPDYWWATAASVVFTLGCVVLVTGVVTATAGVFSRVAGRGLMSRGRGVLLQAGDALARPSAERRIALGVMAIVLALVTWISAASDIQVARTQATDRMQPDALVRPLALADFGEQITPAPAGYPAQALDADLVGALLGDDRVIAIPFAYLGTDAMRIEEQWFADTYMVVDDDDLTRLAPDGLRPLGFGPGVTMRGGAGHYPRTSASGGTGIAWITADGASHPTYRSDLRSPGDFVDAAWAQSRFGTPPINGVWLQLAHPDGLSGEQRADAMDTILDHHLRTRSDASRLTFVHGDDGMVSNGGGSVGGIAAAGIGLLLGVALVGALAARSARDRRRDLATMAALGASPWTLRLTPVVEMAVTTASAVVAGVGTGLVLAVLTTQPLLFAPGAPLSASDTVWLLRWNAVHVSWTPIAAAALTAVVLTAMVAAVFAASQARRTPVEELREAVKEGAL
jgi:hypothetical protein